jgi:hypothetical protein
MYSNIGVYLGLLIAIIIILIIYLHNLFPVTTKPIRSIYDIAETGDIVFFVYEHMYPMFKYIRPFISHIGMIIVLPKTNKKYILEIHSEGDKKNLGVSKKGGIHVYPLEWRVNNYKGNTYFAKLNSKDKPSCKDIIPFVNMIPYYKQNIQFEERFKKIAFKKILRNRLGIPIKLNKNNNMFCTNFVGYCLNKLNIISENDMILPIEFLFLKNQNGEKVYNKFYLIK